MSQLFTLKSNNYVLSIDFTNPIQLNPDFDYGIALIGFYSYNSIPNIEEGENTFYYKEASVDKKIIIPTGTYEILDIETYLRQQIIPDTVKKEDYDKYFSLKPNNNTLKCEIQSNTLEIDFTQADGIGKILGFSKRTLTPGKKHESDLPVNIIKVRTIHIDCNISTGAYYNYLPTHTIYEFSVDVDPGYTINEIPRNLIYLPIINKQEIFNITLVILNQDFKPVNFRGEEVIVRLELKKLS